MPRLNPPDFFRDWANFLRKELSHLGFDDAEEVPENRLDIVYFGALQRLVEPRPRHVHVSSSLIVPSLLQPGFDLLLKKVTQGEDLRAHLSKMTAKSLYKDRMLFDWGIHHLHLGVAPDQRDPRFTGRTSEVLLAVFTPDDAYLLATEVHGSTHPELWGEVHLLEALLREWPHLLEPFGRTGLAGAPDGTNPTAQEIVDARRAGVQPLLTLSNGKVYGPAGGGIATDGTSCLAVSRADDRRERIRRLEAFAVGRFEDLCAEVHRLGIEVPEEVSLSLAVDPNGRDLHIHFRGATDENGGILFRVP